MLNTMVSSASNIRTPLRTSKAGKSYGGCHFSRGALYKILANPVYIGRIVHRDQNFPGQHPAIIDQELWDAVQNQLRENRQGHHQRRSTPSDSLLAGRLYDEYGHRLLPSHSQKKSKRFRYYVSETLVTSNRASAPNGIRLPAQEIEILVINSLCDWLSDSSAVLDSLGRIDHAAVQGILIHAQQVISNLENPSENRYQIVQKLVSRVTIANSEVRIALSPTTLFLANSASARESELSPLELTIPAQIRRCGLAMRLIIQGPNAPQRQAPDQGLIQLIAKAHDWFGRLTSGKAKSVQEIADAKGVTSSYVTRVVYRSFLAPDIVQAILEGTQPASLTLDKLKQNLPLPIDWDEQRKLFGFAPTA